MNAIYREALIKRIDEMIKKLMATNATLMLSGFHYDGGVAPLTELKNEIQSGAFDIKPPEVPEPALKPGAVQDLQKLISALNGLVQEFYQLSRDYHRIYKGQSEEYDEHAYGKHWAFDEAAQMLEALLKEHGVTVE